MSIKAQEHRAKYPHLWGNSKNTTGILIESGPELLGLQEAHSLFIEIQPDLSAPVGLCARIQVTVGCNTIEVQRTFLVGLGRSCWLSCAGWSFCKVEIIDNTGGPAAYPAKVSAAWLTEPPPSDVRMVEITTIAAPGPVQTPAGASTVTSAVGDPGSTWTIILGPGITFPGALVAGVPAQVAGSVLNLTGPNTLLWSIEGF